MDINEIVAISKDFELFEASYITKKSYYFM